MSHDHRRRLLLLAVAAVIVGGYLLIKESLPSIDLEELLSDVANSLGDWTYLLVGGFAFLETGAFVGLVAPGETMVIFGGAVAGQGATSVWLTIGIVWFAAWAGDTTSFVVGRKLGRGFLLRHGPRLRITPDRFRRVESYFDRHGGKTILIGRFIGLVRALAPFIAGSSRMRYRDFVPFSVLGTGLWAASFTVLGFVAAESLTEIIDAAERGTLAFAILVGTVVAIVVAVRYLRVAENRERLVGGMEKRRALRPILAAGRSIAPQARFFWARLTPGGLGLELTALVAALAVGLFVLVGYSVTLSGDPAPTPGDMTALEVSRDLEVPWLTDVALAVTRLGALSMVLPVAAIAAMSLAIRGRWAEVLVLVIALAMIIPVTLELKDTIDRPRPPAPLEDDVSGFSFSSGHAAQAVVYAWLALTVVVRLRPGLTGGTAIVLAGLGLTATIGLTRVYLRVHYLSDVVGGWALGVSAFALCGALAIVLTHLRQNAREGARVGEDRI